MFISLSNDIMIRNIRYITSILALVGMLSITVSASAQKSYLEKIDFEQTQGVRKGQQVTILSKVRLDNVRLGHQDLIILVPKVQSNSGTNEQQLPPIFIAGSTRAKVIERESILNNEREYMLPEPVSITTRHNGKSQSVQYTTQIPYSS